MALRSIKKTAQQVRSKLTPQVPATTTPALITNIDATAAETIRLTFNTPVFRNRLPNYTAGADGAAVPVSSSEVSATVVEIVFDAEVQGTDLLVPSGDLGIRTTSGGFVPAGTYAIPTFP